MKRKTLKTIELTAEHASHALHFLLADGKIAARDVARALKRREGLIKDLRERLAALGAESASIVARVKRNTGEKAGKAARAPKRRMSATRRAALKLHGQYLGTVRPLSKAARAKIKVVREESGVRAAIRAARKMATPAAPGAKQRRGGVSQRGGNRTQQRRLAAFQQRERPRPDKHGGSGAGREQGGSGAGRERG